MGEVLVVVDLGPPIGVVEPSGEHVDVAVVVDGAEHRVEVDDPVEEPPCDVALEGPEEDVDGDLVGAGGPRDRGEVLVAAEREAADGEARVSGVVHGRG